MYWVIIAWIEAVNYKLFKLQFDIMNILSKNTSNNTSCFMYADFYKTYLSWSLWPSVLRCMLLGVIHGLDMYWGFAFETHWSANYCKAIT